MDDEIDLRPYIESLISRWWLILSAVILAALGAYLLSFLLPKGYEAQALVAIVRSRTDVSFDARIRSLSDEELLPDRDVDARRQALATLATSNDVVIEVLDELGAALPPEDRNAARLLKMVEASSDGDLIVITARYSDPEMAARIANTWAQSYVRRVNDLYTLTGRGGVQLVASQITLARDNYQQAQAALEDFVGQNRAAILQRQIAAREALLEGVLADHYNGLRQVENALADAQALHDQVSADATSPAADLGNALALISLRRQVYGGGGTPVELQLDLSDQPVQSVDLADVESLIGVLETRRQLMQRQIDALTAELASSQPGAAPAESDRPLNWGGADFGAELLALKAELEAQQARDRELTQARNLAWETYDALTRQQQEEGIAAETTGTEVRLASSAIAPAEPATPRPLLNAVAAAALSFVITTFAILASGWWKQEPLAVRDEPAEELSARQRSGATA